MKLYKTYEELSEAADAVVQVVVIPKLEEILVKKIAAIPESEIKQGLWGTETVERLVEEACEEITLQ